MPSISFRVVEQDAVLDADSRVANTPPTLILTWMVWKKTAA